MDFLRAFYLILALGLIHPLLAAAAGIITIVALYVWPEKIL